MIPTCLFSSSLLLLHPWRSKSLHQNLLSPPQGRHIKRGAQQYNHCSQHSSVTWLIPCICTSLKASFLARQRDSPCYCVASKFSNLLHGPFLTYQYATHMLSNMLIGDHQLLKHVVRPSWTLKNEYQDNISILHIYVCICMPDLRDVHEQGAADV